MRSSPTALVADPLVGIQASGDVRIVWDGKDDLGVRVSGGLYYLLVVGPDGSTASERVVMIR